MALLVTPGVRGAVVPGACEHDIQIEHKALVTGIRALVGFWESVASFRVNDTTLRPRTARRRTQLSDNARPLLLHDVCPPYSAPRLHSNDEPPPSYQDCVSDIPPDYTTTDALAVARSYPSADKAYIHDLPLIPTSLESATVKSAYLPRPDFSASDNIRTRAKKKAKQAAKAAQAAKWADSDNEDKKGTEDDQAGQGGNNDGGGAGSGGGGADPPGGDGGDDGDDWWNAGASGNKKDKKKKKKNAWEEFEDEEEKKLDEEDATKQGESETAIAAADADPEPVEDWGSFAAVGKKGKKKKGKAEPDPIPPPEPEPEAPPSADAGAVDDWAGFTSTNKKKKGKKAKDPDPEPEPAKDLNATLDAFDLGDPPAAEAEAEDWFAPVGKKKKGKKGKDEDPAIGETLSPPPPPPPAEPVADDGDEWMSFGKKTKKDKKKTKIEPETTGTKDGMRFDDINLSDDKAAPQLDLELDLKKDGTGDSKSNGFSFGGWGGGWSSSSWGFSNGSDAPTDAKPNDSNWTSTSSAKKDKDKKKSTGFDFSFDNIAGEDDLDTLDLGIPDVSKAQPSAKEDTWATFGTGKQDKKSKKKSIMEPEPVIDIAPAPAVDDKSAEEDVWSGFSSKKDKKSKKKVTAAWEPEPDPVPDTVAKIEPEPAKEDDDPWGTIGMSAKDKKKAAKKSAKVVKEEPPEEPAPSLENKSATGSAIAQDDAFESLSLTAKKTKKSKKGQLEPETSQEHNSGPPETSPMEKDPWASFGSQDKKKKKSGFGFDWGDEPSDPVIDVLPPPPVSAPEPATDWLTSGWGDTSTKKTKKSAKKSAVEEPSLPTIPAASVAPPSKDDQAAEEDWFGGWGTSSKDKKKKTKADTFDIGSPALLEEKSATALLPEAVIEPKADEGDDWLNSWSTGTKKKASKKDKSKGVIEVVDSSPGASVLLPESVQEKSAEEDPWASWTTGKKAKAKGTKKTAVDLAPPAIPPPPAVVEKKTPGNTAVIPDLLDTAEPLVDDPWSFSSSSKKKTKPDKKGTKVVDQDKSDPPGLTKTTSKDSKAQADFGVDFFGDDLKKEKEEDAKASAGWSSLWGSSNKKETSKEKREREKKEREEREAAEAQEALLNVDHEPVAAADEILSSPKETAAQRKQSSSKDKASSDIKKRSSDKTSKIDTKAGKKDGMKGEPAIVAVPDPDPLPALDEPTQADGWGFWGASLKPSQKAAPTTTTKAGRNASADLNALASDLPSVLDATLEKSTTNALTKSKTSSKGASIQDRIKALQGDVASDPKSSKTKKSSKSQAISPPEQENLLAQEASVAALLDEPSPPAVADKKSKKGSSALPSSKSSKRDTSLADTAPKPSVSPVPGGFPDDDFLPDAAAPEPETLSPPPKKSSKDKKASGKSLKKDTKVKAEIAAAQVESPLVEDVALKNESARTTGVPSPSADEKKTSKKERPRVVRDQGSSSWGFWGATPSKKTAKDSKDREAKPSSATERPPGLVRSKSARKASNKDNLEPAPGSSASEQDSKKDTKSRPSTSRGMGFAMFGIGAPPSRSKSTRKPSTVKTSRRHSSAVEENAVGANMINGRDIDTKAAKLIGADPSGSNKVRQSRKSVPDPFPLDSDDLMVDGPEDSAKDIELPSKRASRSKRHSSYMSGGLGVAPSAIVPDLPDQLDEVQPRLAPENSGPTDRPALTRRNTSSAKKSGIMGGLFGALAARPAPDRRASKAYESEDAATRRQRSSGNYKEEARRIRRDDRVADRSRKSSAGDGLTDVETAEAREARRRERRERRNREISEDEAGLARRKARERETEQQQLVDEEEREVRRREERRARRAEKEAQRAEEERLFREEERQRAERRERRQDRERRRLAEEATTARPRSDRRRSHIDNGDDEEARRLRREERRLRRSMDIGAGEASVRSPRNMDGEPKPSRQGPYFPIDALKSGNDKTASWVHSLNEEPPPPPPVEGTIIDAPMHFAEDMTPDAFDETTAREFRSRRRREQEDESQQRRRRRQDREGGIRSSDESSHARQKSLGGAYVDYDASMAPKRGSSWLKKFAGFA